MDAMSQFSSTIVLMTEDNRIILVLIDLESSHSSCLKKRDLEVNFDVVAHW